MNARRGRDVADLSPGTVLVAGSTDWRYRVQAADQEADRVVLRGPHGSLSVGYEDLQRSIANGHVGVRG
jgi:xanthine dehydrogenase iron-sulfur cluster and FAD-binding subunit A